MATKKPAPKKAAKKVVKPAPKPAAKKATPAKKPAKPVAKPAAKKSAPAKKPAAKPAAKKVVPAKKPAAKPVAKPAPKKVVVVKKPAAAPAKVEKHPAKPIVQAKPVVGPAKKAPVPVKQMLDPSIKSHHAKHDNTPIAKPPVKKQEPLKDIKVPKTSTKTSVPYNPEYKPLDQRKDAAKSSVPLVRYNDADLNEFRELINRKLDAAKKELSYLQGLITRKDEMGGDEAESRYMTMEDGSMSMEREQLSQMASRQITYIDHLEKALIRIENKTYGICRVTGKLIDKARLRAVPHATLSLEAKLGIVRAE
jgi:RNA polymerase-binding transcription factor DksA